MLSSKGEDTHTCGLAFLPTGICCRERSVHVHQETYTRMFMLFVSLEDHKWPNLPLATEWIDDGSVCIQWNTVQQWNLNTIMYLNPTNLRWRKQGTKEYIWYDSDNMKFKTRQNWSILFRLGMYTQTVQL